MIKGIVLSKGITRGKVSVIKDTLLVVEKALITNPQKEIEKLSKARLQVEKELLSNKAVSTELIEAHILMLNDPVCIKEVHKNITDNLVNAGYAYSILMNKYCDVIKSSKDDYMSKRYIDVLDIKNQVINKLQLKRHNDSDLSNKIVYKQEVYPSDMIKYINQGVIGIITHIGGSNSHSAILARSHNIPYMSNIDLNIVSDTNVILNCYENEIIIEPNHSQNYDYEEYITEKTKKNDILDEYRVKKVEYQGKEIDFLLNISSIKEVDLVEEVGAKGIGLFRTEFLFIDSYKNEQEQYEIYQEIVDKLDGKEVTFRTIDIGADKSPDDFDIPYTNIQGRGLDFTLNNEEIFKDQLKALLRLRGKNIKIMFPMVNDSQGFLNAMSVVDKCKIDLHYENILVNSFISFGVMIETKDSVENIEKISHLVDFVSIGSNDLIKSLFKVDRIDNNDPYKYQYSPSLLQKINQVIKTMNNLNKPVGVCGEMASEYDLSYLLILMGINSLSMNSFNLLDVKKSILEIKLDNEQGLLKKVLDFNDEIEVKQYLYNTIIKKNILNK